MNVLSLFDGISCGQVAINRAGIKYENYFASEIDKHAIKVTMKNWPNTIQLGSVVDVTAESLPKIDLLIGGSPCQSFSFAGKRKGMATKDEIEILTLEQYLKLKSEGYEFEGQSYLFWEYMRLLTELKPKYFLLENVEMGEKWERVLSEAIGVKALRINSNLVSAQNRKRLYFFGQIRERLFYFDNYCYNCNEIYKEKYYGENKRVYRESQDKGEPKILAEAQRGQVDLQNLQNCIFKDKQEGNDKDLLNRLPKGTEKEKRQKQRHGEQETLSKKIPKEEQGQIIGISKEIQAVRQGEGIIKKNGAESSTQDCQINENTLASGAWNKKEAEQRRIDYNSKYGKEVCCVLCGERIDIGSYNSFIERRDKSFIKPTGALSEMQFNETRQNNGRVFDVLKIGIKSNESLFGEIIIDIPQPIDKKIFLKDVLEKEVDNKYYLSEKLINFFESNSAKMKENGNGFRFEPHEDFNKKSKILTKKNGSRMDDNFIVTHNGGNHSDMDLVVCGAMRGRYPENPKSRVSGLPTEQMLEIRDDKKTNTLTSVQKDNLVMYQLGHGFNKGGLINNNKSSSMTKSSWEQNNLIVACDYRMDEGLRVRSNGKSSTLAARGRNSDSSDITGQPLDLVMTNEINIFDDYNGRLKKDGKSCALTTNTGSPCMRNGQKLIENNSIRRLTPIECERLQTLDDGYTSGVSESQRYKSIGNGWTVDVVAHIFRYLKG